MLVKRKEAHPLITLLLTGEKYFSHAKNEDISMITNVDNILHNYMIVKYNKLCWLYNGLWFMLFGHSVVMSFWFWNSCVCIYESTVHADVKRVKSWKTKIIYM